MQVRSRVGSATGERLYVIFPVAGASAGCEPRREARSLPLKFPRRLLGSMLSSRGEQGRPARQRNHRARAVAQAASIVYFRFLDAVGEIIEVGRVIAVL